MQTTKNCSQQRVVADTPLEPVVNEVECSKITGRSVGSLRRDRLIGKGIPFVKLEFLVRYRQADIRRFLESNLRGGSV